MIFLIVYSRIGAALRSHRSTHPTLQNKNTHVCGCFYFGGSGWIRTTSGLSQQIYSLPRLSNSGARPIPGASSGTRTRISSLEGLRTSPCTMLASNSKQVDYILIQIKIKILFSYFYNF